MQRQMSGYVCGREGGCRKGETYGKEGGRRGGSVSDGKERQLVPKNDEVSGRTTAGQLPHTPFSIFPHPQLIYISHFLLLPPVSTCGCFTGLFRETCIILQVFLTSQSFTFICQITSSAKRENLLQHCQKKMFLQYHVSQSSAVLQWQNLQVCMFQLIYSDSSSSWCASTAETGDVVINNVSIKNFVSSCLDWT